LVVGKALGAQQQTGSLYDLPSSPGRKNQIEGRHPCQPNPRIRTDARSTSSEAGEEKIGDERSRRLFGQLGNMRLQFSLLRGNLIISDGVEAWTLTDGKWERAASRQHLEPLPNDRPLLFEPASVTWRETSVIFR
jgi:hypothetical protein